jgi:hypothetical protein
MHLRFMLQIIFTGLVCSILVACGGGTGKSASNQKGSTGNIPIKTPANFHVSGKVGPGTNIASARINAYDAAGNTCGLPVLSDSNGNYYFSAKCTFPIVIFADLQDGNDAGVLTNGATGEGRKYFNYLSEIRKDGSSFIANLTPTTAAITTLALSRIPVPGVANPVTFLNESRRADAHVKIKEALDGFAKGLALAIPDYLSADIAAGSAMEKLFSVVKISFERIDSTKQNVFRFKTPSEHRPVVLVSTDNNPLLSAYFDSGLGILPTQIDGTNLQTAQQADSEIKVLMAGASFNNFASIDPCFLHNGTNNSNALFDVPIGWASAFNTTFENITLLRLNTYADFTNETLEYVNTGAAKLAFISFDFRNKHGLKQRAYTWLINGTQNVQGCNSSGTGWRVLGNQRPIYLRTDTIAVHETTVSQQFGSRKDVYGSGTEHFLHDLKTSAHNPPSFTHVLVNGPGFASDGNVFIRNPNGHEFLFSTATLLFLRQTLNAATTPALRATAITNIQKTVKDTRAVMLTDPSIKQITDSYYDESQNVYTYRFFTNYDDLYPTLTLMDVLPKRPYLSAELPVDYYHSVSVNIDSLVQSLQTSTPVQVNWSLPLDIRLKAMLPESVFISRMNCLSNAPWPACINRDQQYNEYSLGLQYLSDATTASAVVTPELLPDPTLNTFKGYVRVRLLDSLNRPIETRTGMDYQR